jgi:hypothetical protein
MPHENSTTYGDAMSVIAHASAARTETIAKSNLVASFFFTDIYLLLVHGMHNSCCHVTAPWQAVGRGGGQGRYLCWMGSMEEGFAVVTARLETVISTSVST